MSIKENIIYQKQKISRNSLENLYVFQIKFHNQSLIGTLTKLGSINLDRRILGQS